MRRYKRNNKYKYPILKYNREAGKGGNGMKRFFMTEAAEKKKTRKWTAGRKESSQAVMTPKGEERLRRAAYMEESELFEVLETSREGISRKEAQRRSAEYGVNKVTSEKKQSLAKRLAGAFINPFTAILFCLAAVSAVTDILIPIWRKMPEEKNPLTVTIILVMIFLSGILRFVQESRSGNAAQKLLDMITTTCTVDRKEEKRKEIPLEEAVPGDIIHLSVGDMVPADVRILESKDLFVSQSALTGESEPVEKKPTVVAERQESVTDLENIAFMSSNVISGSAMAVVVNTGDHTIFGSMTAALAAEPAETSFTKGVNSVSWVLIRFMLAMVPIVFFLNGITKGNWPQAFLFAISIAVGLTPEMLPMIVTTCLARGAVSMSKKKTIVKNLSSIQNLGAMDILCTDKTGTLTQDKVALQYHMDVTGKEDGRVLQHAYLNSFFQTGYKNLMDLAIIERAQLEWEEEKNLKTLAETYVKEDEIPFDFSRRRLSVLVREKGGKVLMVTKGAVEEMMAVCAHVEYEGERRALTEEICTDISKKAEDLNDDGMRVLAVAVKEMPENCVELKKEDEKNMVLLGYLAFLDPPKDSARAAMNALGKHGVKVKILTGDNERVTRCICRQMGIPVKNLILGSDVEKMDDRELLEAVEKADVFAKLSPRQKSLVVKALKEKGHTVGFLGDGINDAAAMKEADIGISVDTAVDVAKEAADIILLEKDLMVLEEGIVEGRKTYANMLKYIKMTASSNFGNMFSVLAASALLPFLPMTSVHLIILNLIYDLSCTAIPWDNVDEEFLLKPRKWDASSIGSFMLWMGPVSSVFDWLTYIFMYFVFCPLSVSGGVLYNNLADSFSGAQLLQKKEMYEAMFQAGWFIESMWSQTLVIHMIRTKKIPFIGSHASASVTILTFTGMLLLTVIPFTPLGTMLGFTALPLSYFAFLFPCILLYMLLVTSIKKAYVRYFGELL